MNKTLITSVVNSPISEGKMGQIKDLLTPVLRAELNDHTGQYIIEGGGVFQKIFRKSLKRFLCRFKGPFHVNIENRSLHELIRLSNFDYINDDLLKPAILQALETKAGSDNTTMYLIALRSNGNIPVEKAERKLASLGFRSATFNELLLFADQYKRELVDITAMVLTSLDTYEKVPYVSGVKTHHGEWHLRFTRSVYAMSDFDDRAKDFILAVAK